MQTWHGTPLKTLFFDTPRVRALPKEEQDDWQEFLDRWDYVVIPNDYYEGTFLRSSNSRAVPIRAGLPRNDVLVNRQDPATIARLKRELGLPTDRRIVLYAPTYRPRREPGAPLFRYPDLAELAEALGEDHFLVLRQHYYRRAMRVPPALSWFARDLSRTDEIGAPAPGQRRAGDGLLLRRVRLRLAAASDGLLRPDLEHYAQVDPRTYVDLADVAPGPIVESTEELVEAVRKSRDGQDGTSGGVRGLRPPVLRRGERPGGGDGRRGGVGRVVVDHHRVGPDAGEDGRHRRRPGTRRRPPCPPRGRPRAPALRPVAAPTCR